MEMLEGRCARAAEILANSATNVNVRRTIVVREEEEDSFDLVTELKMEINKIVFKERSIRGSRYGYIIFPCSEPKEAQLSILAIQSSAPKCKPLIIDRVSYINPFSVQLTLLT